LREVFASTKLESSKNSISKYSKINLAIQKTFTNLGTLEAKVFFNDGFERCHCCARLEDVAHGMPHSSLAHRGVVAVAVVAPLGSA